LADATARDARREAGWYSSTSRRTPATPRASSAGSSSALRVTPPDDTESVRVYFNSTPCRGDLEVRAITDPRSVA
jgi:hypothetical protein